MDGFFLKKQAPKFFFVIIPIFLLGAFGASYRDAIARFVWKKTHWDDFALAVAADDHSFWYDMGRHYFNGGAYDINKATRYYEALFEAGIRDREVLHELGRIYFISGRLHAALTLHDLEIELYPEWKRGYYVRGLVYMYMGMFGKAAADFSVFTEAYPEEWAGHNDLAWARYKLSDFEGSYKAAQAGLEHAPDNMWLHNMSGVALWNLGDLEGAEDHLLKANELVREMDKHDWGAAYPGNSPETYAADLAKMRQAVALNLKGVQEELLQQK